MEAILIHWFQLIVGTFDWLLWVYQQWWAWAFVAVPAVALTFASLFWIAVLVSPITIVFGWFRKYVFGSIENGINKLQKK